MPGIEMGAIKGVGKLIGQVSRIVGFDQVEALKAGAEVILPYMQSITPVATGELRDSEKIEVDGKNVNLVAEADHASYVELGTSKMHAQPYMRPAIDARQKDALKAIGENLQEQIGKAIHG